MTTKLYGGDKRLFTAAEARRIDIERGGEGRIKAEHWGKLCPDCWMRFDEDTLQWVVNEAEERIYVGNNHQVECWLPVTPEPEPIVLDYLVLVDANERIKQLEKELKLLQEANDEVHDLLASREKELAEATQNYHEILADHGELTQKFDELKQKELEEMSREITRIRLLLIQALKCDEADL